MDMHRVQLMWQIKEAASTEGLMPILHVPCTAKRLDHFLLSGNVSLEIDGLWAICSGNVQLGDNGCKETQLHSHCCCSTRCEKLKPETRGHPWGSGFTANRYSGKHVPRVFVIVPRPPLRKRYERCPGLAQESRGKNNKIPQKRLDKPYLSLTLGLIFLFFIN